MKKCNLMYKFVLMSLLLLIVVVLNGNIVYGTEYIAAPKNLKVYNPEVNVCLLTWDKVEGAEQYCVYVSTTSKYSGYNLMCATTKTKIQLKGMQDCKKYYIKIRAVGNGYFSECSNVVEAKKNIYGIDVSHHNGTIDWAKAKASGLVDFAIVRCGYGSNLISQDDREFKNNVEGCKKYGIPMGIYIYSYAMTDDEALSEAEHVLRLIKGLDIKCKIWYDLEDPGTTQKLSNAAIASIAKTFCNRISKAGYSVGIYASKYWFNNILNLPVYEEWPKWVAQYNSVCTYEGSYLMWQYSSTGKVPGLYGNSGNVDMNYAFSGQNISRKDADTYEVNKGNIGYLNTPKNVEGNAVASDEVSVSWNRVENAVSYGVYRSRYKAGKYKMIGKTNSTSYVDKSVSAGETYYYKIRAVSSDSSSKYSSKVTVKTMVGTVENLATGIRNTSELMLTWEGNAKEYEVYMSTGLKKKFTKVRVVDKNRAVISGLKFGKTYYFKVRGREKLKDNQILRGDFSVIISAKTSVGRASGVAVKSDKAGEITVSYNKENGVNGYCVYLATDKDGTYKNVSDTSKTTCVKNGLVSGKKYYVMVRMYKMNGNKKIWGEFSYIKGIVVK